MLYYKMNLKALTYSSVKKQTNFKTAKAIKKKILLKGALHPAKDLVSLSLQNVKRSPTTNTKLRQRNAKLNNISAGQNQPSLG